MAPDFLRNFQHDCVAICILGCPLLAGSFPNWEFAGISTGDRLFHKNFVCTLLASCGYSPLPMMKRLFSPLCALCLVLLSIAAFLSQTGSVKASSSGIVISQVYGGGGNAGATLTNDFIEIFNAGANTVSLTGWSVQYAAATGTSWQVTNLSGSLAPGQYYLIQESKGAGGTTPLPTPNATGNIAMSATAGKVALVSNTIALTVACPAGGPTVIDFVGYGTGASGASCGEGGATAPGPPPTTP